MASCHYKVCMFRSLRVSVLSSSQENAVVTEIQ